MDVQETLALEGVRDNGDLRGRLSVCDLMEGKEREQQVLVRVDGAGVEEDWGGGREGKVIVCAS